LSPAGYGATVLEVDKPETWGETCVSAGEKYGRKVFPDVTAKFAAEKKNVQEGEISTNLKVQMDG
jgi:hypothetical protein